MKYLGNSPSLKYRQVYVNFVTGSEQLPVSLFGDIKLLTKYDFVAQNNNLTAKIALDKYKRHIFLTNCGFSMFKILNSAKNEVHNYCESAILSLKYWRYWNSFKYITYYKIINRHIGFLSLFMLICLQPKDKLMIESSELKVVVSPKEHHIMANGLGITTDTFLPKLYC